VSVVTVWCVHNFSFVGALYHMILHLIFVYILYCINLYIVYCALYYLLFIDDIARFHGVGIFFLGCLLP
jgi:hypothetical protein